MAEWRGGFCVSRHRQFLKCHPPWRHLRSQSHVYMAEFWPSAIDNIDLIKCKQIFPFLKYRKYSRVRKSTVGISGGKELIAVIRASGSIRRVKNQSSSPSSGIVGEQIMEKIRSVRGSNKYKAVIIRIDSPGGDALASDFNELDDLDSKNHIQRFEKYDGDYAHYLMGKCKDSFNLSGGDIVDTTMESVENENISSSRFQFVRSHADSIVGVEVKRSTAQKKRKRSTR